MAKARGGFGNDGGTKSKKKTSQGQGRGTKVSEK